MASTTILARLTLLVAGLVVLSPSQSRAQGPDVTVQAKGDDVGQMAQLQQVAVSKSEGKWFLTFSTTDPKIGCRLSSTDGKLIIETRRTVVDIAFGDRMSIVCARGERSKDDGFVEIDLDARLPLGTFFAVFLRTK
jgi:hypothetical protein